MWNVKRLLIEEHFGRTSAVYLMSLYFRLMVVAAKNNVKGWKAIFIKRWGWEKTLGSFTKINCIVVYVSYCSCEMQYCWQLPRLLPCGPKFRQETSCVLVGYAHPPFADRPSQRKVERMTFTLFTKKSREQYIDGCLLVLSALGNPSKTT